MSKEGMTYRVWTKNAFARNPYTICTDWQSYRTCLKHIVGRWGHWPAWAFISKCPTTESFIRHNGR